VSFWPPARKVTPLTPATSVGVRALFEVPSPIWPSKFQPQHETEPPVWMTQTCWSPETNVSASVSAVTATGTFELAVPPLPSAP